MLTRYKSLWTLVADGKPFVTHSSLLQPVIYKDMPCMLKVAMADEERRGNLLMSRWQGNAVARILKFDKQAILMERAAGARSLAEMAVNGRDNEASNIICSVVHQLHTAKSPYPAELIALDIWFKDLEPAAGKYGGVLTGCSRVANTLLNAGGNTIALHGDIHHGNILDFGDKGWLAIDPKGLIGERTFDYANIFCNPDAATATTPGRLETQVLEISKAARLEAEQLLRWVVAWAGLSAAWGLNDGENADVALHIAEIASAELSKFG
ncbi:3'-kinase [Mucilaginibacter ginsenosidivorans]|uniref:3'-kinase n=1 Tax=Mucilaginibacter ginsenosidivorans TaxID=398053 RepID=A0A5B8V2T4_9SPHI|nr:3'-kinase [Mucilaginibacter ginsenosidivorans]